jgi:SAM-dependent methyltransferase
MSRTHPAVEGFDREAERYERGRPGYPPAVVRHLEKALDVRPGQRILELGPGTGKFTRALEGWRGRIIGVEPTRGMRAVLGRTVPHVDVVAGTADAIPLKDASVDQVLVAQAFHWFPQPVSLGEIARVLRPGGGLGLVWNIRDETVPWVARWGELMDRHVDGIPRTRSGAWRSAFAARGPFEPLSERSFGHLQFADRATLVDRTLSVSAISLLDEPAQRSISEALDRLLGADPTTQGREVVAIPYRTDVYTTRRRG